MPGLPALFRYIIPILPLWTATAPGSALLSQDLTSAVTSRVYTYHVSATTWPWKYSWTLPALLLWTISLLTLEILHVISDLCCICPSMLPADPACLWQSQCAGLSQTDRFGCMQPTMHTTHASHNPRCAHGWKDPSLPGSQADFSTMG